MRKAMGELLAGEVVFVRRGGPYKEPLIYTGHVAKIEVDHDSHPFPLVTYSIRNVRDEDGNGNCDCEVTGENVFSHRKDAAARAVVRMQTDIQEAEHAIKEKKERLAELRKRRARLMAASR